MRVFRSWLLALAIPAAVLAVIYLAARRTEPLEVRAVRVGKGKVEKTVSSTKAGAIRSRRVSNLSVETAGTIVAIHAREGQKVASGDPLVSIDRREAAAALSAAQAELKVLESLVKEAEARRREAARNLERVEGLHASGVATDAERDQARLQADATSAVHIAADSRVETQKVAVSRARIALDKCELRAPFAGVVAERFVELGEWAVPGKLALRFLDPGRLYVRAELDEVDIGPVREGLPARVTLDPYRDRRLSGRVSRVAPFVSEVQEQNRTLEVEVELTGGIEGIELKPGTSADVEVILDEQAESIRIPTSALMEGDRVFVVDAAGRARATAVRIGLRNWEFAQVLDGVREGDLVIVSLESERLKEGTLVRVAGEAAR